MTIGMKDYVDKVAEQVALGVNSVADQCLARLNKQGAVQMRGFMIKNRQSGSVIFSLLARGKEVVVTAEAIVGLRVGTTNQVKGAMANRRVKPGSILISDTTTTTPQIVEDLDGDGNLYQTAGPVGTTYPVKVGTVNYIEGTLDFIFRSALTGAVPAAYVHTNWKAFTTPITSTVVAGGGRFEYRVENDGSNFITGLNGEEEIGFFAKKLSSSEENTMLSLKLEYFGDDSQIQLPIKKGEIDGYPHHTA